MISCVYFCQTLTIWAEISQAGCLPQTEFLDKVSAKMIQPFPRMSLGGKCCAHVNILVTTISLRSSSALILWSRHLKFGSGAGIRDVPFRDVPLAKSWEGGLCGGRGRTRMTGNKGEESYIES